MKLLISLYLSLLVLILIYSIYICFNLTVYNILSLIILILFMKVFYNYIYTVINKNADIIAEEMIRLKHKKKYKGIFDENI